jgi:hypothetical protein
VMLGFGWVEFLVNDFDAMSIMQKEEILRETIPNYDQLMKDEQTQKNGSDFIEFVCRHCSDRGKRKELIELFLKEQRHNGSCSTLWRLFLAVMLAYVSSCIKINQAQLYI